MAVVVEGKAEEKVVEKVVNGNVTAMYRRAWTANRNVRSLNKNGKAQNKSVKVEGVRGNVAATIIVKRNRTRSYDNGDFRPRITRISNCSCGNRDFRQRITRIVLVATGIFDYELHEFHELFL